MDEDNLFKSSLLEVKLPYTENTSYLRITTDKNLAISYLEIIGSDKTTRVKTLLNKSVILLVSGIYGLLRFKRFNNLSILFKVTDFFSFHKFVGDFNNFNFPYDKNAMLNEKNDLLAKLATDENITITLVKEHKLSFRDSESFNFNKGTLFTDRVERLWNDHIINLNSSYYCIAHRTKISVFTWNVNAYQPIQGIPEDLRDAFKYNNEYVDVLFIALQEVDMGVKSTISGKNEASLKWLEAVKSSAGSTFEVLGEQVLGGVFTCLLYRREAKIPLKFDRKETVRLGLKGYTANKGACIYRCYIGMSRIVFIGCHLKAHKQNWEERNQQLNDLLIGSLEEGFDYLILAGDLNYRIELKNEDCRQLIKEGNIESLFSYDQLKQSMDNKKYQLYKFKEPKINFTPTYKYEKGIDEYNSGSKARVPSYTDRILVTHSKKRLPVGHYDRPFLNISSAKQNNFPCSPSVLKVTKGRSTISDHRSVNMIFSFLTPYVADKRMEAAKKLKSGKVNFKKSFNSFRIDPKSLPISGGLLTLHSTNEWLYWEIETPPNLVVSQTTGYLQDNQSTEINVSNPYNQQCFINIKFTSSTNVKETKVYIGGNQLPSSFSQNFQIKQNTMVREPSSPSFRHLNN